MCDTVLHALIIDDDPDDRDILQAYLARLPELNITLHEAGTWEEARNQLQQQAVDIIFLDFFLGGITGLEILRSLRAKFPDMPIIMMTGQGDELLAAEVMRTGADDYLVKSRFDRPLLKKSICGVLEHSRLKKEKAILEAELRQSQKMECMGVLITGIAHDFNNILSPILGYAQLALETADISPTLQKNLNGIITAVEHARDLIQQIHRFCRKTEAAMSVVKLQHAIKDMLRLIRTTIPASIDIEISLSEQCQPVLADITQIYQILMNLCTNAALAMQDTGGILRIILDETCVLEAAPGRDVTLPPGIYTRLSVQDTGCGMRQEIVERIFDPFFTTRPKEQGTGMGLAVVYGIVSAHDGKIVVESKPDEGSIFRIYFPVTDGRPACQPVVPETRYPSGNGQRLLLVDDNEQVLGVQKMMLERIGYQVVAMADSQDALSMFSRDPSAFDGMVTDIDMPRMGGIELFQHIRRLRPEVPVIFSTGIDESLCQLSPMDMEHCAILTKPIQLRDMAQSIQNLLSAVPGKTITG